MDPLALRPLADLIAENRADIDKLAESCKAAIETDGAQYHDDLWLLRHVLSARGKFEKAVASVNEAIAWRTKHAALLEKLASPVIINGKPDPETMAPHFERFMQFNVASPHKSLATGEPILIVRVGLSNPIAMMDNMTDDEVYTTFMFNKEYFYQMCDRLSRQQGRLVKMISLMDMRHISLSNSGDKRFFAAMGRASKDSEPLYPQLVGLTVVFNLPLWMRAVVKVAKVFMSKQTMEKLRFCSGKTYKHPLGDCPMAEKLLSVDDLPTFLGGKCSCASGCIQGHSNDLETIVAQHLTAQAKAEKVAEADKKNGLAVVDSI